MPIDASRSLPELLQLAILPAIGFLAGLAAQWILQERKSRDEIVSALAESRAVALRRLWDITTIPDAVTTVPPQSTVPESPRRQIEHAIIDWYTREAGALFLSWHATRILFRLLDALRNNDTKRKDLEQAVSALRTRLKRDCGIYTGWEARRTIPRPRPSPWSETHAVHKADPG